MNPLISICIPAYRAEKYLLETLESIGSQSFQDWEIIVTEDGSSDRTEAIVEEFAKSVSQTVRYTRHDPNRGLPETRNAGFAHAKGEWLAIVDADDLWTANHLSSLVATQKASNADIVFSSCDIFESATGEVTETRGCTPDYAADPGPPLFLGKLVIQPSTVLFNRNLVAKVGGFSKDFPICNDLEFWLRLYTTRAVFAHTGQTSCLYRKHPDAMSTKTAELIAEVGKIRSHYKGQAGIGVKESRNAAAVAYFNAFRISRKNNPRQSGIWLLKSISTKLGIT